MPGTWRRAPFRPSSPQKPATVKAKRAEFAVGDEDPDGDRQIETGATLPNPRRSQIDGQAAEGPRQPARQDGGAHPIPRFTYRRVRETDDGEAGETVGNVDLD